MRRIELSDEAMAQLTPHERSAVEELWSRQERQAEAAEVALNKSPQPLTTGVARTREEQEAEVASQYAPREIPWRPTRPGFD